MTIGEITVIVACLFAASAFSGVVWWKRKSLGQAIAEFQYPLIGVSGPVEPAADFYGERAAASADKDIKDSQEIERQRLNQRYYEAVQRNNETIALQMRDTAQSLLDLEKIATAGSVDRLVKRCYGASVLAGWWTVSNPEGRPNIDIVCNGDYVVPQKLCLIHSEISEALEGFRKNKMDDHLPHRKAIEVELADAVIRICDLAGALDLDLGDALVEKMEYNANRADHKKEARSAVGGKKF